MTRSSCSLLGVDGHAPEERHYPSDERPTTGDIKRCYSFAIAMLATESDYCRRYVKRRAWEKQPSRRVTNAFNDGREHGASEEDRD